MTTFVFYYYYLLLYYYYKVYSINIYVVIILYYIIMYQSEFVYLYSSATKYNLQLIDVGVRMAACHARQKCTV